MKAAKNQKEANEINKYYRTKDCNQYSNTPGVIGTHVHLSNNHPEKNLCNDLVGIYPSWFIFDGHKDNCMCFVTSVLASDAEYERYYQSINDETDHNFKWKGTVTELPDNFIFWVKQNGYFLDKWDSAPSLITKNFTKNDIIGRINGIVKKPSFLEKVKYLMNKQKKPPRMEDL
jgi:hypothetical protein